MWFAVDSKDSLPSFIVSLGVPCKVCMFRKLCILQTTVSSIVLNANFKKNTLVPQSKLFQKGKDRLVLQTAILILSGKLQFWGVDISASGEHQGVLNTNCQVAGRTQLLHFSRLAFVLLDKRDRVGFLCSFIERCWKVVTSELRMHFFYNSRLHFFHFPTQSKGLLNLNVSFCK